MKRIVALLLALSLFLSLVLVGCSSNETQSTDGDSQPKATEEKKEEPKAKKEEPKEEIILRLADVHNEGYPTMDGNYEFKRLVEEKTNGRIKVEIYGGGQLGDEKTVIEQVQFGAIDLTRTSISPLTEFNDMFNVLMLPYLYRDKEHMFNVLDGEIGDMMLEDLADTGFVGLGWYDSGSRCFYNSKGEIESVADLEGLKIRVQKSSLMMGLVEALGASPTPMAFSEVYSALQTGVIDGAENNWPSYLTTSHYEVAPFYVVDEHTRVPELVMISKITYDKLSDEDKAILHEAGQAAAELEREKWAEFEVESEKTVVEAGCTITRLEAASKAEFQEAVKPLYDEFAGDYTQVIEDILNTK
ncbi:TRAP transporter substrate-binding protein [Vallitalea okinawensis]|uniref:TRAP transporter substrate-binding protein n=1 Tax=Vallitalea okinawensis TaxID=2078660 RepID=UPI000CFDE23B|nr:TRAP transporter substrate-binding protein [Vallitalea okinawensis]